MGFMCMISECALIGILWVWKSFVPKLKKFKVYMYRVAENFRLEKFSHFFVPFYRGYNIYLAICPVIIIQRLYGIVYMHV